MYRVASFPAASRYQSAYITGSDPVDQTKPGQPMNGVIPGDPQQAASGTDQDDKSTTPNFDRNEVGRWLFMASLPNEEDASAFDKYKNISNANTQRLSVSAPSAAQLLSMLRSAGSGLSVRQIISTAMNAISSYRMAASLDKLYNTAQIDAEIAQLQKIVERGDDKIKDLKDEQDINDERKKAIKQQEEQRARELAHELKKKRMARYARESQPLGDSLAPLFGRVPGREDEEAARAEEALLLPVLPDALAAEVSPAEVAAQVAAAAPVAAAPVSAPVAAPIAPAINVTA